MSFAAAAALAVTFVWTGLVLGISFVEAPLKFRAPDVTLRIGLGIGRLVFKAVNTIEAVFAVVVVAALVADPGPAVVTTALGVAVGALVVQLVAVRPGLTRRTDAVLAGGLAGSDGPRSSAHLVYIALEVAKFFALLVGGTWALTAL